MVLVLSAVGVLAILASPIVLYFGMTAPSEIGTTYYLIGVVALLGGVALIGLATALKELRRIAEGLMVRPVSRSPRDMFEPVPEAEAEAAVVPAAPRIPFPPKVEPRKRAPMPAAEPRLDVAPSIDSSGAHFDRPEPAFARHAPEPRIVPEREEAPSLSPAEPRFVASRSDEKDELAEGLLATAFSRLDVSMRPAPPMAEPAAPSHDKPQNEMFESLWPAERQQAEPEPEPMEPEPESEPEPEPEPYAEAPAHEQAMAEQEPEPEPEAPYAVSILKSGVVDGMAYTLYSDGSIEAEMPQGTMRFASIHELRAYLEKS